MMSNFRPSSVETITATGEGMVSHSTVLCGTVWIVMVWTISSKCGDNKTTVTGAGAVSRSRQQFSSKYPDMCPADIPMSSFHSDLNPSTSHFHSTSTFQNLSFNYLHQFRRSSVIFSLSPAFQFKLQISNYFLRTFRNRLRSNVGLMPML